MRRGENEKSKERKEHLLENEYRCLSGVVFRIWLVTYLFVYFVKHVELHDLKRNNETSL